jgi:hypothetical protein
MPFRVTDLIISLPQNVAANAVDGGCGDCSDCTIDTQTTGTPGCAASEPCLIRVGTMTLNDMRLELKLRFRNDAAAGPNDQ